MNEKTYQILDIKVNLILPVEIHIDLLSTHIPNIKLIPTEKTKFGIGFKEDDNDDLLYNNDDFILICGTWNDTLYHDIPHLLYTFLRKKLIERFYFPIHSVMIENNLYIAHSGAGKTTLADKAIDLDMSISSLDKTVVKIEENKLIKKLGTDIISRRNGISEKIVLSDINEIKSIYLFFISNSFSIKQLSYSEIIHSLYPFFMDTVKSECIVNNKFIYSTQVKGDFKGFIEFFKNFSEVFIITGNHTEILKGKKDE